MLDATCDLIDVKIACKVLTDSISTIIESKIPLPSFVDKLLEKEIINDVDKRDIIDTKNGLSIDERWRTLLELVQSTINLDGSVFLIFLNAIKEGGSVREKLLADKLNKV